MNNFRKIKIIAVLIIILVSSCHYKKFKPAYIPEIDSYICLCKYIMSDMLCDGSHARLYISKTDSLGSDYIDFRFTQVTCPEIYFVEPDTLFVIDKNNFYIRDIKSSHFVIEQINLISPEDLDSTRYDHIVRSIKALEINDSIRSAIKAKSNYYFSFGDNATEIFICDNNHKIIAESKRRDYF